MALRLMDFVTENQVEEEKELYKGGPQVQNRVAINDRPLFEILKDNRDRKDAELSEKFKHQPPKALDDDETEFLEAVEMHKREVERQQQEQEAEEIETFQAALASRASAVEEARVFSQQQKDQRELPSKNKRPAPVRALPISVRVKPIPKKMKSDPAISPAQTPEIVIPHSNGEGEEDAKETNVVETGSLGLVSYGESDDDDED